MNAAIVTHVMAYAVLILAAAGFGWFLAWLIDAIARLMVAR